MSFDWLTFLILLPLFGGAFVLRVGSDHHPLVSRYLTLAIILFSLLACIPLYQGFNLQQAGMQYEVMRAWVPSWGLQYHLGIDGLSLVLIILSIFTNLVVVLATWKSIRVQVSQYLASFLMMQGLLVGVFSAMDAMLFYVFWEATLIPMYLIIGIWGSANRVYAAIKFFLYTFLGSVLMLVAFLYMGHQAGNYSLAAFDALKLPLNVQVLIFIAFFLSFCH
jgi:NADH:ubiquinone oxidoreductase subunit 4 (chain M)